MPPFIGEHLKRPKPQRNPSLYNVYAQDINQFFSRRVNKSMVPFGFPLKLGMRTLNIFQNVIQLLHLCYQQQKRAVNNLSAGFSLVLSKQTSP